MVQRTSDEVQFGAGSGVAVQQSALGNARPDFDKNKTSTTFDALTPAETSADRILANIAQKGSELGGQLMHKEQQEAYLDGAAKAGTVQSEKDLDGNIFTKQWQTAGYRDTMGKVAISEHETRILRDMPKLREASPEKFNEYLTERRSELMPQLTGMSMQQRQSTFQNLLLNDHAAIKLHTTEHIKFQAETENRANQGAMLSKTRAMDVAKADGSAVNTEAYDAATAATFSTLMGITTNNTKLTPQAMGKLVHEVAAYALSNDHQKLYKRINEDEITLPNGEKGTLGSMMTWEDATKLNTQYRESVARTLGMASSQDMASMAKMSADWHNPDTPLQPASEVLAFRDNMLKNKFFDKGQGETFLKEYYTAGAKKVALQGTATAWAGGDSAALMRLNKTDEEGVAAWTAGPGRLLSPEQRVKTLLDIGIVKGRPSALTEVGKQLAPALAQIGLNPNIDQGNAQSLTGVIRALDAAEKGGKTGVFEAVMSSYPPDMQDKMMSIREGNRAGLDPVSAIVNAQRIATETSKMTKQERIAMGELKTKEDVTFVQQLDARGAMATLGLKMKAIFSSDAQHTLDLTARSHWFENPERVAEAGASVKYAALEEMRYLASAHPMMSAEARRTSAMSSLSARTVDTEGGPLIIPRGQTYQTFFGVPPSTAKDRIGAAMDKLHPPSAEGNRLSYYVDGGDGGLMFKEFNKSGQIVGSGKLNAKEVAPAVAAAQDSEVEMHKVLHGPGVTQSGVTFNGDNTAGASNLMMYQLRKNLLNHEGVRDTPYEDLSGKVVDGKKVQTVGVGVSSHTPYYPKPGPDGKVTPQQINESFKLASNAAANAAKYAMDKTGKRNDDAFLLFSELAYQSGESFAQKDSYKPMVEAIRSNNPAAAQAALATTPAYRWTAPDSARRKHYVDTLNKLFKG